MWFRIFAGGPAARILAALLLVLALAAGTMPVPEADIDQPSPLLWKIEQGNSTLYLFGTFHLLKADTRWLNPAITSALDEAGELLLEITEDQTDPQVITAIILDKGMYKGTAGLEDALGDKDWRKLVTLATAVGIPEQAIGRFRPWYASIVLSIQYVQAEGFLPEFGAEAILTARAKVAGIPVRGLETAAEQLSTLADHPERVQLMMLEDTLQQLDELPAILNDMTSAWVTGDAAAIEELIVGAAAEIPELYEALLAQRNRNWIAPLEARLGRPGVTFLAVGVGHLVGDESVITLLRDKGYRVVLQE